MSGAPVKHALIKRHAGCRFVLSLPCLMFGGALLASLPDGPDLFLGRLLMGLFAAGMGLVFLADGVYALFAISPQPQAGNGVQYLPPLSQAEQDRLAAFPTPGTWDRENNDPSFYETGR